MIEFYQYLYMPFSQSFLLFGTIIYVWNQAKPNSKSTKYVNFTQQMDKKIVKVPLD